MRLPQPLNQVRVARDRSERGEFRSSGQRAATVKAGDIGGTNYPQSAGYDAPRGQRDGLFGDDERRISHQGAGGTQYARDSHQQLWTDRRVVCPWSIPETSSVSQTKSDFKSFNAPGASATLPSGINNLGQIVGTFFDNMAHQHGFFRDANGAVTVLDLPGAMITFPNGINDLGQIVGSYLLPPPNNDQAHAFVYSGASFTTLEVPGASGGAAYGINNGGQIVGTFVDGTGTHGFLHTNGNFTRFDVPGAFETEAKAINDLGQIVGEFGTPSNGTTVMHGFLRDTNGRFTTFDAFGESSTFATGINKSGQIVGHN
jgi:probable HAF family extracellular repeat protein